MGDMIYDHVTIAAKLGDSWFNSDEGKFALIPNESGAIDAHAAQFVEKIIRQAAGETLAYREDVVRELLEMQAQQLLLWPLGLLWGRSGLGRVHEQWFMHVLSDVDPDLVDQRLQIEASPALQAVTTPTRRGNLAFVMWKMLASLVYSSTDVDVLDDIQQYHVSALAQMVRPRGEWAEWTTIWTQRSIRYCVQVLATQRQDPNFGREIDEKWPAAGFVDTEIRCLTELEGGNAKKEVQPRVQA